MHHIKFRWNEKKSKETVLQMWCHIEDAVRAGRNLIYYTSNMKWLAIIRIW